MEGAAPGDDTGQLDGGGHRRHVQSREDRLDGAAALDAVAVGVAWRACTSWSATGGVEHARARESAVPAHGLLVGRPSVPARRRSARSDVGAPRAAQPQASVSSQRRLGGTSQSTASRPRPLARCEDDHHVRRSQLVAGSTSDARRRASRSRSPGISVGGPSGCRHRASALDAGRSAASRARHRRDGELLLGSRHGLAVTAPPRPERHRAWSPSIDRRPAVVRRAHTYLHHGRVLRPQTLAGAPQPGITGLVTTLGWCRELPGGDPARWCRRPRALGLARGGGRSPPARGACGGPRGQGAQGRR